MRKNQESLLDIALVAAATAAVTTAAILAADKALKSEKGQAAVATVKSRATDAKETVKTKAVAAKETVKTKTIAAKDTVVTKAGAVKDKVKSKLHKGECPCEETAEEISEEAPAAEETVAE